MFKFIGVALAIYVCHAVLHGQVFAKSGVWGRTILREESPVYFWVVIGIYTVLSLFLLFVF